MTIYTSMVKYTKTLICFPCKYRLGKTQRCEKEIPRVVLTKEQSFLGVLNIFFAYFNSNDLSPRIVK